MTANEQFHKLKEEVLLEYKKHYPYFTGNWKTFSSQDIQNLILLIEEKCRQPISEKWIYTHLKPESNEKLPRKDMLNILAQFTGHSGWDEFIFEETPKSEVQKKTGIKRTLVLGVILLSIGLLGIIIWKTKSEVPSRTIEIKDAYTNEKIGNEEIKVYQASDTTANPIKVENARIAVADTVSKIVIKSPYYKTKTVALSPKSDETVAVELKPDDYAMMLKAFMFSDIKGWETRKLQLDKILSDDLEVMIMLKGNLGAEYFDKKEFAQKLVIPSVSMRRMKIIEIEKDENQKIKFIRLTQE